MYGAVTRARATPSWSASKDLERGSLHRRSAPDPSPDCLILRVRENPKTAGSPQTGCVRARFKNDNLRRTRRLSVQIRKETQERKLGIQDSNLDKLSQSQLCYRYTNPHRVGSPSVAIKPAAKPAAPSVLDPVPAGS